MKRFLLVMRSTLRISCSIPNNTEVHGRTFTRIRFPVTSTTMSIAPRGVDHPVLIKPDYVQSTARAPYWTTCVASNGVREAHIILGRYDIRPRPQRITASVRTV